MQVILIIYE